MTSKLQPNTVQTPWALLCVLAWALLLSGCASVRANKDPSYQGKMNNPIVVWQSIKSLKTTVSARFAVTASHRAKSDEGVGKLLALVTQGGAARVSSVLQANAVNVVTAPQEAKSILRLQAASGSTDCTVLGCSHSLVVHATLTDIALSKQVWAASAVVAAPLGTVIDDKLLQDFVDRLVGALQSDKLI